MSNLTYTSAQDLDYEISNIYDTLNKMMLDCRQLRNSAEPNSAQKTWLRKAHNSLQECINTLNKLDELDTFLADRALVDDND